jgi:hypothetical protein
MIGDSIQTSEQKIISGFYKNEVVYQKYDWITVAKSHLQTSTLVLTCNKLF